MDALQANGRLRQGFSLQSQLALGHGDLDASEFVDGCMRLKGPARSIDVCLLLQEQRRLRKKVISCLDGKELNKKF